MAKQKKSIPLPKLDFTNKKQGFAAVLIGILVALFLGVLVAGYGWVTLFYWILIMGVIVGILNIFHKEAVLFLISGLTITFILKVLAASTLFPTGIVTLFNAVIYLLAPATIVVGVKVLYALASK